MEEALLWFPGQPILQANETSYRVGNADGNNSEYRGNLPRGMSLVRLGL